MQNFNLSIFSAINAGYAVDSIVTRCAIFAAQWLIYVAPLVLLSMWIIGARATRRQTIEAGLAACIALLLAQGISYFWYLPRPFAANIGVQLLSHTPNGSFPSHHMTFISSIAIGLLITRATRAIGVVLAVCAILIAWGRVYVGVHWPFDMIGGLLFGALGVYVAHGYGQSLITFLARVSEAIRAAVFNRMQIPR